MAWQTYQVVFRLRTPTHIGWGKVGNLQRTRPYVTGRVMWGALTMRLTRNAAGAHGLAPDAAAYQRMGAAVHQALGTTYFYPATEAQGTYQIAWPWEHPQRFRYRFLSSYSSTALSYPQQSAATGMLHEVEFLTPQTLDSGEPVFLVGYVFVADGGGLNWQAACQRLQVGGERGYGWGDLELVCCQPADEELFAGRVRFNGEGERPILYLRAAHDTPGSLLAHTYAHNLAASGEIEPLVGREWRSNNARYRYAGQHVSLAGICFAPGSTVDQPLTVVVEPAGMWRGLATNAGN